MKFHIPTTISINGMSSSGKTHFLIKLLKYKEHLFDKPISKILYCYSLWTKEFDDIERSMDISFHKNLPNEDLISKFVDGKQCVIIIDDMMDLVMKSEYVQNLFTRGSHHQNLTIIYLSQNLFSQGKTARTIGLNTHYIILMKNLRDVNQIKHLGRQLGMSHTLSEAYQDVMKKPYAYLIVDLSPHNYEPYKLYTNIFPQDGYPIVYLPV